MGGQLGPARQHPQHRQVEQGRLHHHQGGHNTTALSETLHLGLCCAGAGCGERARARDRGAVPVRLLLLLLRQGLVAGHRGAERGAAVLQGGRRDGGVVAP